MKGYLWSGYVVKGGPCRVRPVRCSHQQTHRGRAGKRRFSEQNRCRRVFPRWGTGSACGTTVSTSIGRMHRTEHMAAIEYWLPCRTIAIRRLVANPASAWRWGHGGGASVGQTEPWEVEAADCDSRTHFPHYSGMWVSVYQHIYCVYMTPYICVTTLSCCVIIVTIFDVAMSILLLTVYLYVYIFSFQLGYGT